MIQHQIKSTQTSVRTESIAEHPELGALEPYGIFKTVSELLECCDKLPREEPLLFWKTNCVQLLNIY